MPILFRDAFRKELMNCEFGHKIGGIHLVQSHLLEAASLHNNTSHIVQGFFPC